MHMNFKENVNILSPSGKNKFPKHFGNEIYYVEDLQVKLEPYSYSSNFSLKCVFSGEENYIINNKKKRIKNDQYLVVNDQSDVTRISSKGTSISVFLRPELLSECYRSLTISDKNLLEYPNSENQNGLELFDDVMPENLDCLLNLKSMISCNPDVIIPLDYYFEISEQLLLSQRGIFKQMNQLERGKFSTRKEIFRRVNIARNYVEDTIFEKFDLDKLSNEASLSKFQLIRDFKKTFGITPHRYYIIKKMAIAYKMIKSNSYVSLNDIAFKLNYPSLSSFSRQFKQVYGCCPSSILKS